MLNLVVRTVTTGSEAKKHSIYAGIKRARISTCQDETVCELAQMHSTLQLKKHESGCLSFRA
jgi:hypothetical protein